jgi:hypothetical protein
MLENQPQSTLSLLRAVWSHLSRRRRLQLGMMLLVMLASGLAELMSLGAVLPFMAVLSNPQQLWSQPLIQWLAPRMGIMQPQQLVIPAAVAFALAAVLSAVEPMVECQIGGESGF